ncbi:MAG: hypothetical protein Ct9H300mP1_38840 [Planctomycetaceae bacterium]|nr:MAG: hypothetical protein Ct9H300mP1_38840 [Planctomycetaceae bacterium]
MLYFLDVIHSLAPGTGLRICHHRADISVRLMMHPLTRKQALSAKIMKDLKPEIEKLKEKHGDDKQAFGRAQMELFRKHSYNPFSGCLPIIVQLPILSAFTRQWAARSISAAPASLHRQSRRSGPAVPPRVRHPLPGIRLQPAAVDHRGAVPGQQPHVHAAADNRRGGDAAEDDERDDDRLRLPVLSLPGPGVLCYFIVSTLWGMGERKLMDLLPTPQPKAVVDGGEKPRKGIWGGSAPGWTKPAKGRSPEAGIRAAAETAEEGGGGKGGRKKKKRRR